MSGYLWKRAALKYQKRFFFIVANKLYYRADEDETNNIVCGKVVGVKVLDAALQEMAIVTEQRTYEFRVESAAQMELWVATCERLLAAEAAGAPSVAPIPEGLPPPLPERVGDSLDPAAVPVVGGRPLPASGGRSSSAQQQTPPRAPGGGGSRERLGGGSRRRRRSPAC